MFLKKLKQKNLHTWLGGFARSELERVRNRQPLSGPRHLLFSFCDHYEPLWGSATAAQGDTRVDAWSDGYPKLAQAFSDSDGVHPRHSFFFPGEQYEARWLEALANLARLGLGEVELHLHHDGDTRENLLRDIQQYLKLYAAHGHLSRDATGRLKYAFIHGNWCLANARRDGRHCGVDDEMPLLFETGCYADFTFPAAPDESQPNRVNQIYWPAGDLAQRRAYEHGSRARVGEVMTDRILMVEGPLALCRRKGKLSFRIENAAVTANDPATPERIANWVAQNIHVAGRPEWVFVKVHTHGAPDKQGASLLGEAGRKMHTELVSKYNDGKKWMLHYVTAREMYNVAIAAMRGESGNPGQYRDYELARPPVVSTTK